MAKGLGKEEMGKKAVVHTSVHIGVPDNKPGFGLAVDIKVEGVDEEVLKAGHEVYRILDVPPLLLKHLSSSAHIVVLSPMEP